MNKSTTNNSKEKRIAIVGSGISGQTCGYILSKNHHVTLFEANHSLGGHTATIDIEMDGKQLAVDTGFIVFNDRTYPNFIKMMKQVGIHAKPTEMSFSVHNENSGLEYNGHSLNTLFAQRRNLLNPKFYHFIAEILRFNKLAKQINNNNIASNYDTLGDFLDRNQFGIYFADNYLYPMVAAIWSSSMNSCRDFPLRFFLQFFNNHGLLDITRRPQWYVIDGGSRSYIHKLTNEIRDIRLNSPVQSIRRHANNVEIVSRGNAEIFDEVIIACHSDQALSMLSDASFNETTLLNAIKYRNNEVILHTDRSILPRRKTAYASWNYRVDTNTKEPAKVTYNMNILQGLISSKPLCVTLNQTQKINPKEILREFNYSHPVFSVDTLDAQKKRSLICGKNRTHFCGAYWYNGFHEDGVKSALDVCQRFGANLENRAEEPALGLESTTL